MFKWIKNISKKKLEKENKKILKSWEEETEKALKKYREDHKKRKEKRIASITIEENRDHQAEKKYNEYCKRKGFSPNIERIYKKENRLIVGTILCDGSFDEIARASLDNTTIKFLISYRDKNIFLEDIDVTITSTNKTEFKVNVDNEKEFMQLIANWKGRKIFEVDGYYFKPTDILTIKRLN